MTELSQNEIRIIGCLIEKSITTPDTYPLSLNSLTSACNQKSNRDPILELDETTVQVTLDELEKKNFVSEVRFGGRVAKYQHRFYNTEFSEFRLNAKETAIICLLFLRGAQTPGELRTRSNRLANFTDLQDLENTLDKLSQHPHGPLVLKLEREPGKRENRYIHLFNQESAQMANATTSKDSSSDTYAASNDSSSTQASALNHKPDRSVLEQRVALLESEVSSLKGDISALQELLEELTS